MTKFCQMQAQIQQNALPFSIAITFSYNLSGVNDVTIRVVFDSLT